MSVLEQYNTILTKLSSTTKFESPAQFTKFLSIMMKDFDLKFKTVRSKNLEENMICFNGLYDPEEDKQLFPCIDIEVLYWDKQKIIDVSKLDLEYIIHELCETVYHEKIHQLQYRNRKFKEPVKFSSDVHDQEYLGCPDEIEAYGAEMAFNLYLLGLHPTTENICNNKTFLMYKGAFDKDSGVVDALVSYCVKYFNNLKEQDHASLK